MSDIYLFIIALFAVAAVAVWAWLQTRKGDIHTKLAERQLRDARAAALHHRADAEANAALADMYELRASRLSTELGK